MPRGFVSEVLTQEDGDVVPMTPVAVFEEDGTTPYAGTLYTTRAGGTVVADPTTDSLGRFTAFCDEEDLRPIRIRASVSVITPTLTQGYHDPRDVVTLEGTQSISGKTISMAGLLTLASTGQQIEGLEHPLTAFTYPFAEGQDDYQAIGLSYGTPFGVEPPAAIATPLVNIQHRVAPSTPTTAGVTSASMMLMIDRYGTFGDAGTATGAQSSTTLQDTSKTGGSAWTPDQFAGWSVYIHGGTGTTQVRVIVSNTTDTLTVSPAWTTTPVAGSSEYVVNSCSSADHVGLEIHAANRANSRVFFGEANSLHGLRLTGSVEVSAESAGRAIPLYGAVFVKSPTAYGMWGEITMANQSGAEAAYFSQATGELSISALNLGGSLLGVGSDQVTAGIVFAGESPSAAMKSAILFMGGSGGAKSFGIDVTPESGVAYPIRIPNATFLTAWRQGSAFWESYAGRTSVLGGVHPQVNLIGSDALDRTVIRNDVAVVFQDDDGLVTYGQVTADKSLELGGPIYPGSAAGLQGYAGVHLLATLQAVAAGALLPLDTTAPTGLLLVVDASTSQSQLVYVTAGTSVTAVGTAASGFTVGADSGVAIRIFSAGGTTLTIRNGHAAAQNLTALLIGAVP